MTLTNEAKAAVALTTRLGTRERPSLTAKMWHDLNQALADAGYSPVDVFDRDFDIASIPGVDTDLSDRIRQLTSDAGAAMLEVDELRHRGIWTTTISDPEYPVTLLERLQKRTPPVLFGVGNVGLLSILGVGIVGSRDVDDAGAAVAQALAIEAVNLGRTVISGGARGVDQLAMNAAFSAGGSVVGVLADSLTSRIRSSEVLIALDRGTVCLITQQSPSTGFTPAAAMSRNKIVYGLAGATVVIASDDGSGGTWAGVTEALKTNNGIVAVWRGDGEGPGNQTLERMGAQPISDPSQLGSILEGQTTKTEQMRLDLSN